MPKTTPPTKRTLLSETTVEVTNTPERDAMTARSVTAAIQVLDDNSPVMATAILSLSIEKDENGRTAPAVSLCYTQKSPGSEELQIITTYCALELMRDTITTELKDRAAEYAFAAEAWSDRQKGIQRTTH